MPSSLAAAAAAELMDAGERRSFRQFSSVGNGHGTYGSVDCADGGGGGDIPPGDGKLDGGGRPRSPLRGMGEQIPSVIIVSVLNFMIGIPFGAAYFPVGWSSNPMTGVDDDEDVHGVFPLPGKEALGIRMYLFSTAVAQLVFTYSSRFDNGIGLQMVENVPFCVELARIVISDQGYGMDALSTLFFLFGMSSVAVGVVFYLLGKLKMGRVVYFFPSHVLIGCIGGIGAFIAVTAIEVATNSTFSFTWDEIQDCIDNSHLIGVVLFYELSLRALLYFTQDDGKPRYPLLAPAFYLLITPTFYLGLWMLRVDKESAESAGFFFPALQTCEPADATGCSGQGSFLASVFNEDLFDMWRVVNFSTVSWVAVTKSIPTLISLVAFSLIHVPINIPAFAISMNTEPDMNAELIAHGYSNAISGLCVGLQNYMCYCNSVLYAKTGGKGRGSSLALVAITIVLFIFGPTIASYVPRCMAGTLLLHVGIDLFLESVLDTYGKFDYIEYGGIWLIAVVMVVFGMSAALIAGAIAALSTYAFQSVTYQNPIRGTMSADTLRGSSWNRPLEAESILQDKKTGRKRIFVVQLQGHLFFGNVVMLSDSIKDALDEKRGTDEEPLIVILDFTLINGMDSSAAQAMTKLKDGMHRQFNISLAIFVTGSPEGFPCEYNLSEELSDSPIVDGISSPSDFLDCSYSPNEEPASLFQTPRASVSKTGSGKLLWRAVISKSIPSNHVCECLDSALIFAEDVLIALEDPTLLEQETDCGVFPECYRSELDLDQERQLALQLLMNLCLGATSEDLSTLCSFFEREKYTQDQIVWRQGDVSDSAKLVVNGNLMAMLENEADTVEAIRTGAMIGELGLVNMTDRLSTVKCVSTEVVLYSISREKWDILQQDDPRLARFIDMIVVRNLAHRVQHVSNRIFETRCLPV